jgi:hypothetical protein
MTSKRIFSDKELKAMETPLADQIAAAIDAGEYEKAKSLARQLDTEDFSVICTFEDFVAALLSHIYEKQGDQALLDALQSSADFLMKAIFDQIANLPFRELVEAFAGMFRAHSRKGLKIEEDDEKVTLTLDPCGSGQRMVQAGYFGPSKLQNVKGPLAITFGRDQIPCYCSHCTVFHHLKPIEWSGRPFPPIEVGPGPGPCKWHFYKDPDAIPARYYEQVGKKKAGP